MLRRLAIFATMLTLPLLALAPAVSATSASRRSSASASASASAFPTQIPLPDGFLPEGIASGRGATFFAGSTATGAVFRGNFRTGTGSVFVPGVAGRVATGLKEAGGRLFVSGGPTGRAFIYDARTGKDIAQLTLTTAASTFINDVIVTRRAAFFTDSINPFLYRVDRRTLAVTAIPLTGDIVFQDGFNVNGIAATPSGRTLILVQTNTGKLFTASARTGATREIDLGGADVLNGDGILLSGRTLFVVQNQNNQIASVALSRHLRSGRVVSITTDPRFDVPTTITRFGARLYAVNARFNTPPTPTTTYDVIGVPIPRRR